MEQSDLFRKVIQSLEELDIAYMIVGSVASSLYGEPRLTQDIDIVIDLPYGKVEPFCQRFPQPDFYVSPEAARNAIRHGSQFNIICPFTNDKVDLVILRYGTRHEDELRRRRKLKVPGDLEAFVACPEDVILAKMQFYSEGGSEKHLRDITGILRVSGTQLDTNYIDDWAKRLDVEDVWQAVLRRAGMPNT